MLFLLFFFFSSRRRHTRFKCDWSSDVCSSDLDAYVDQFQAAGGSMVMLAKGNRSPAVREACRKHGGFYLGSIRGAAADLAQHFIKKVEVVEYPQPGMEGILRIQGSKFPRLVVVADKGN